MKKSTKKTINIFDPSLPALNFIISGIPGSGMSTEHANKATKKTHNHPTYSKKIKKLIKKLG